MFRKAVNKYGIDGVGVKLGEVLSSAEMSVVEQVVPRAIAKHADPDTARELMKLIKSHPKAIKAIRAVGVSIANSLRPYAGNRFTKMVSMVLDQQLKPHGIQCVTHGAIKQRTSKKLIVKGAAGEQDLKPDIDIIAYDIASQKVFAIISCKTSLAERIMQTVRWKEALVNLPPAYRDVRVFLVTAWDDFENSTQRNRARTLDGAYACNENVREDDKIKRFDKCPADLIKLRNNLIGKPRTLSSYSDVKKKHSG